MDAAVLLLAIQGAMGAFDTLFNHEWVERLAQRREARAELGLHSIREAIYAALFAGLAWFEWHGALAFAIGALLLAEVADTACDEYAENRCRVLPQNERVLHVFLTLNLGMIIALLVPVLAAWASQPSGLVRAEHGWLSWLLTAFALSSAAWSLRDVLAWRALSATRL